MHKFSRQLSFLENLLLAVIRSHPLEADKSDSDEKRLSDALRALTGSGRGTGSAGLNDELTLFSMAYEHSKDLAYTGRYKDLFPEEGAPKHVKKTGKPRSIRALARNAVGADFDNANAERLRKKYSENKTTLLRAQTALGDDNEIHMGFEYQAIRKIIELLNQHGVQASIKELEF